MKLPNDVRTHFVRNTVLWNASLAMALLPWMQGTAQQDRSQRFTVQVRDECTFSDGAKITFGHTALAKTATGGDVWQTGNFQATAFRVSARTIIPPMDSPIDILPGLYTLFVDPSKGEPWTLIISKKVPQAGMPYPGEQYDRGRVSMGVDDSARAPVEGFVIGCTKWGRDSRGPMFLYIESGTHVAYAKIQTMNTAF